MKCPEEKLKEYRINWIRNNVKGKKILDIGPVGKGGSFFAHTAVKESNKNSQVFAVDLEMHSRFLSGTRTPAVKGDILSLPFLSKSFDAVFLGEVIEHLENPYQALMEISRILKKKGSIYITTPNKLRYQNIKRAIRGRKEKTKISDRPIAWHHYEFSYQELDSILENAGLKILSSETMPIKIGNKVITKKLPIFKNLGHFWFIKAIKD
jgi:ubiquinone/menaquinone biosynthesis C-methylase UbiE